MNTRLFFLSLLFAQSFFACESKAQYKTNISPNEFEKGIAQKEIQILDVRTQTEYINGHLKNAYLADWMQPGIFEERIRSLDKDKPVYTYCLSGARSSAAAARLKAAGFTEVYNMEGGMVAWKAAKKTVEGIVTAKAITMEEYLSKISTGRTVLVDIGAVWCPPCKKMEPVIKELVREKSAQFLLVPIDGGVQDKLAEQLNAAAFPTFIVYKKGKEVWRQSGIVSKEVLLQQLK